MASLPWITRSSVALMLAASALGGCRASYVDRGAALYAERNYVAADEVFEHNETRAAGATGAERARYALYRGVTLLSLGDFARSQYWLGVAAHESRHEQDALSSDEHATLSRAMHAQGEYARVSKVHAQEASASLVTATAAE